MPQETGGGFLGGFRWAARFELHRIRKLQISNAEIEVLEGPNYGPESTRNLSGFSNRASFAIPDSRIEVKLGHYRRFVW